MKLFTIYYIIYTTKVKHIMAQYKIYILTLLTNEL